jgi:hypothetical protein
MLPKQTPAEREAERKALIAGLLATPEELRPWLTPDDIAEFADMQRTIEDAWNDVRLRRIVGVTIAKPCAELSEAARKR